MRSAAVLAAVLAAACSGGLEPRKNDRVVAAAAASPPPTAAGTGQWTVRVATAIAGPASWMTERTGNQPASLTLPSGAAWQRLEFTTPVPRSGVLIDRLSGWARDRDGTMYLTAQWTGNPDQANNIGIGIYRLEPSGSLTSLVDCFQVAPGQTFRFNEIGLPDVDGGEVAFWAGRGGNLWSGVYLWSQGRVISIADRASAVSGEGTPSIEGGTVAFVGHEAQQPNRRALFVWSRASPRPVRIVADGDAMPSPAAAGATVQDLVIAEPEVSQGRVYFVVREVAARSGTQRILGWESGALRTVVHPSSLGTTGPVYIQTGLFASGDAVAFHAVRDGDNAILVARGGAIEEVAHDGQVLPEGVLDDVVPGAEPNFDGAQLTFMARIGGRLLALQATRH